MRRVPLNPWAPKVKRGRSPRGSVAAAVTLVLGARLTVAEAAAITGADRKTVDDAAWEAVKLVVRERDSRTCLNCGHLGTDVHHRVRRGMGGTADPVIAFGLANLVLLCRECHALAHKTDKPEMADKGYRLETRQEPADEPLILFSENGTAEVWLTADGGYVTAAPGTAGAA